MPSPPLIYLKTIYYCPFSESLLNILKALSIPRTLLCLFTKMQLRREACRFDRICFQINHQLCQSKLSISSWTSDISIGTLMLLVNEMFLSEMFYVYGSNWSSFTLMHERILCHSSIHKSHKEIWQNPHFSCSHSSQNKKER